MQHSYRTKGWAKRLGAMAMTLVMLFGLMAAGLPQAQAVTQDDINNLKSQAASLSSQKADIQKKLDKLSNSKNSALNEKLLLEQKINVLRSEIAVSEQAIAEYGEMITQKESELAAAKEKEAKYYEAFCERVRSMEERGNVSYWSVIFNASSFSDLLDKVNMINEIAESDKLMLEKMADVAAQIATERAELETQMDDLEQAKNDLAEQQTEMEKQRAESDQLILQMAAEYDSMSEEYQNYEKLEDEMSAQIKKTETDYFNALSKEEAARQAELNRQNNNKVPSNSGNSGSAASSTGGFLYPLPYAVSITDAYGYRIHPLSGTYKWHNGVDLAAGSGTAIYATQSGTVTSACYNEAYGNMVTINHANGYSSLYGHMTNYIVSVGDYVTQGQTIGYVGSTGWSTGPHLHFTIYYNGSDVNPMNYVSMP